MDDKEIKELKEKYPDLFNLDDNEVLFNLMRLILARKDFHHGKGDLVTNNPNFTHSLKDDFKKVMVERSKEKFEEFQSLSPDEKSEKLEEFKDLHKSSFDRNRNFFSMFRNGFSREINIDPGRLLGLTDGIFGMVITLLAFGIGLPDVLLASSADFVSFIFSLSHSIGVVLVSFIFVSSFWIYHHEFLNIKTLNLPFLWLHILFLACITFIPFTTSIIGVYSQFFLSEVLFGINVFVTIVSFLLLYRYAISHDFLEERVSLDDKRYTYHTFFIIMFLTVVVNLGDFLISPNFIYLFFLVPVISTVRYILKN